MFSRICVVKSLRQSLFTTNLGLHWLVCVKIELSCQTVELGTTGHWNWSYDVNQHFVISLFFWTLFCTNPKDQKIFKHPCFYLTILSFPYSKSSFLHFFLFSLPLFSLLFSEIRCQCWVSKKSLKSSMKQ